MFLDALLVILGLLLIALSFYRKAIGSLFLLGGAYISTVVAALSYEMVAYRLTEIGKGQLWFEALMFIVLYLFALVIFFIVSRMAFPDTSSPKLRFFDPILGGVVGIAVALISMSMVYRGMGYMVSQTWEPFARYSGIYGMWASSRIGPLVNSIVAPYLYLLYPFFIRTGLPPVLL